MIKWIIIGASVLAFVGIIVLWAILARKKGKKNAKKLDDNITKFKSENEALDKQAKIDADKKKEEDAFANITLTDDICCGAFLNGLFDDFVIHICKVGYKIHIISLIFHISSGCIKTYHRTCITNVNKIIHSRSAHIHLNLAFFYRYKFFFSF